MTAADHTRRRHSFPLIAGFLLFTVAGPGGPQAADESAAAPSVSPKIGEPAPLHAAPDLGGQMVDLPALLQGKVGLVAFWASWCQPCIDEIPSLRDLARNYRDRGLVLVGVGLQEEGDTAAKQGHVAARHLVNYQLLFDQSHQFQRAYSIRTLPLSVLIGPDGKIRWQGAALPDDLETRIQTLLKEQGSGGAGQGG